MSDEAKKVLEETWSLSPNPCLGSDVHGDRMARMTAGDSLGYRMSFSDTLEAGFEERARIAACAPEALRLLLEAEKTTGGDYDDSCRWCQEESLNNTGPMDHHPNCEWYVLMKKAGLR